MSQPSTWQGLSRSATAAEKEIWWQLPHYSHLWEKSLNWPEMKAEDTTALNKISIFLMRYKNAMEGNKYLTKHDQPDTIRKLMKSPSSLRKTWRHLADHIIETKKRPVTFSDLAEFVDNEARISAYISTGPRIWKVPWQGGHTKKPLAVYFWPWWKKDKRVKSG